MAAWLALALALLPQQETIPERGLPQLHVAPVDAMLRRFVREHQVPGAALAVMREGQLVYARGFGWADPEHERAVAADALFRIASISKPLTAVAVLQLVEAGQLALDDNPFETIGLGTAIREIGRDPRLAKLTIEQLLQHRAGWDRGQSFDPMFIPARIQRKLELAGPPDVQQIIRFMLDQPLDFDPGTRYAYSNFGYCLLGRVLEVVTGQSYEQVIQSRVLQPLGITGMRLGRSLPQQAWPGEVSYIDQKARMRQAVAAPEQRVPIGYAHDQEVLDAHGGWVASAADLARFADAFHDPAASQLLKPETIATMWSRPAGDDPPVWYGMGWSVRAVDATRRNAWHSGLLTGGTSTLLVRRHDGYSWAVLFNTDRSASTEQTLSGLVDPLIHRAVNQVEAWPVDPSD